MSKTAIARKQLIDHFPSGYTPTDKQVHTLDQVQKALDTEKDVVIICAPTGSGKSMIAKALANMTPEPCEQAKEMIYDYSVWETDQFGNYSNTDDYLLYPKWGGYALTITKQLQAQYAELFKDTKILMGKSNYQCQVDLNFDVETAPCLFSRQLKHQCWNKNICPYYTSRNDAVANKFSALNYKMFLSLPTHVRHRSVIICDEASELEDTLVKQFSANISYAALKYADISHKTLVHDTHGRVQNWLVEVLEHANSTLEAYRGQPHSKLSDHQKIKLKLVLNIVGQLTTVLEHWNECEYVVEKDVKQVSFTPLKVDKLSKHIFAYSDKTILLSASIIDPQNFAKTLGIKDFAYVEVDSTFDSKKSPIFCSTKCALNFKNVSTELPKVAKQISQILENHKNEKGIIHTHSLEITNLLKELLKKDLHFNRLLFRENGSSNQDIFTEHLKSSEPTVLVSPSLGFGIDLLDNLARFQILCKAPFSPLGNKRIKTLFDNDKIWYTDQCLKAIIQMCGRTTRSVDDWSTTYILDANIPRVVLDNKDKLPKHFLSRFQ